MSWYVLFVATGREEQVKKHINHMMSSSATGITYELLIAKREIRKKDGVVRTVKKRMFPGYILLETENILNFYLALKTKRSEHFLGSFGRVVTSKKSDLKKYQTLYD